MIEILNPNLVGIQSQHDRNPDILEIADRGEHAPLTMRNTESCRHVTGRTWEHADLDRRVSKNLPRH